MKNVSVNQKPGRQSCCRQTALILRRYGNALRRSEKKNKQGRGRSDLASGQVSLNSVKRFQRRSGKCLSQSEARAVILFFRSAQKHNLGRAFGSDAQQGISIGTIFVTISV